MTQTATAMDGETVDEICHRVLGKTAAVTEQVLELNPGLAELGPRLPGGTAVIVPNASAAQTVTLDIIQLWD
ncbi:phage tail protein X [Novosphingobium sp. SG751A]|uniref:tail protein X n=1 Tax=Novosphingobium sp. SG751A TaxID=2587000 RepID=UPI00155271AF|nr:tail protein X [Novosphingobium sp. SG751A]NOW46715.1 phage tail protein X [Novosphingobium sp. SG751A]